MAIEHGAHRVEQAFVGLVAVAIEHGRVGHEMADVADQHQRAALERERLAVRRDVAAIGIHGAIERLAALLHLLDQVATHQAEPVAVRVRLVVGVDRRDGILAVHDRRDRRFEVHVGHARGIGLADAVRAIDMDFDVQAVLPQQDGGGCRSVARVTREQRWVRQGGGALRRVDLQLPAHDAIARRVGMTARSERRNGIQEFLRPRDHARATLRAVAAGRRQVAHGVRAVQRVVQAAPARIRRIERIARVHDGHDELRPRHAGDLGIDVGRIDLEIRSFRDEVADLGQEVPVGRRIDRLTAVHAVPGVDLRLQVVTLREQCPVLRAEAMHEVGQALPERVGSDPRQRQRFVLDQVVERTRDLEAEFVDAGGHGRFPGRTMRFATHHYGRLARGDSEMMQSARRAAPRLAPDPYNEREISSFITSFVPP